MVDKNNYNRRLEPKGYYHSDAHKLPDDTKEYLDYLFFNGLDEEDEETIRKVGDAYVDFKKRSVGDGFTMSD